MTIDDPYITFRYAWNLIHGLGPVFNAGERVEGFTSPLHLLICALALVVAPGLDILFKAKIISGFFAVLGLLQTRRLSRLCGMSEIQIFITLSIIALDRNYAIAASNGLETTLYTFLLLTAVIRFIVESRSHGGTSSSVLLFIATMARPDCIVLGAALLACRVYFWYNRKLPPSFVLGWALPYLILLAGFEVIRFTYFGQWLPNTYYAKQLALSTSVKVGLHYLVNGIIQPNGGIAHAVSYAFIVSLALLTGIGFTRSTSLRPAGIVMLAIVTGQVLFVLKSGGDWMPGWRFIVPISPYLVIGLVRGAYVVSFRTVRQLYLPQGGLQWSAFKRLGCALAAGAIAISCGVRLLDTKLDRNVSWAQVGFSTHGADLLGGLGDRYKNAWVQGGDYILRTYEPGSVIAYSEVGYTSYENPNDQFIDLRGLNDRQIALTGNDKTRSAVGVTDNNPYTSEAPYWRSITSRNPDAIILLATTWNRPIFQVPGYHRRDIQFATFSLIEYRQSAPQP